MRFYIPLLLLLFLSGCIGSTQARPEDRVFGAHWMGRSRDDLIVAYGPPSRSATLENGLKLMQYNRAGRTIYATGRRAMESCATRFWLRNTRIVHVDYRGEEWECRQFINTGEQTYYDDRRP